jgi:hypothetical protein
VLNRLPMARRLVACAELLQSDPYGIPGDQIFDRGKLRLLDDLRAEARDWAPIAADALLVPRVSANGRLKLLVFLALAHAVLAKKPATRPAAKKATPRASPPRKLTSTKRKSPGTARRARPSS